MPKPAVVEASAMGSATLIVKATRSGQEGGARQVEGLLCLSVSPRAVGVCRSVRVRIYGRAPANLASFSLHKQNGRGVRAGRAERAERRTWREHASIFGARDSQV